MKIRCLPRDVQQARGDLLVSIVSNNLSSAASRRALEVARKAYPGNLSKLLYAENFTGERFQAQLLSGLEKPFSSIVLMGWGDPAAKGDLAEQCRAARKLGSLVTDAARRRKAERVVVDLRSIDLRTSEVLAAFVEGVALSGYTFERYRSKKSTYRMRELTLVGVERRAQSVVDDALVVCEAVFMARDLINLTPRDCTPEVMVKKCREVAKKSRLGLTVYSEAALKRLGANLLLAVGQGSDAPPAMVRLVYRPRGVRPKRCLALVGKGVTFDSGGLSIKPWEGMTTMKSDMSGSATVLATMQALAQLQPRVEVRAYLPFAENMINGHATRPGDIVQGLGGKSVEILNTDAEGRLILADALALAMRDGCDACVDLATLTGACVVALGTECAAMYASEDALADELLSASAVAGEMLWRMPLIKKYRDLLKGAASDLKNVGGRNAGSITGALFLQEFVDPKVPWAHFDIAGTAFSDKDHEHIRQGGVGFGIGTLVRWVMGR